MENSEILTILAEIFKNASAELFLVGGSVRDGLLNKVNLDYDVSSALLPEEVEKALEKTDFKRNSASEKFGTIVISRGGFKCEHTTFRKDSYLENGSHKPSEIKFTEEIRQDCQRRDFTVNAIYKNVLTGEVLDFYDGLKDLKTKTLKTIKAPEITFNEDALRILRLVRFSVKLGFKIEKNTLKAAKKLSSLIKNLSTERIRAELNLIILSGQSLKNQKKAIKLLNKLNISKVLFNKNLKVPNYSQDPFTLTQLTYKNLVNKNSILENLANNNHEKTILNKTINLISVLTTENILNIKPVICLNYNLLDGIFEIIKKLNLKNYYLLKNFVKTIEEKNLPTKITDLTLTGTDLLNLKVAGKEIGNKLNLLFNLVCNGEIENNKEALINYIKNSNKIS